jgi:hypothetical protein
MITLTTPNSEKLYSEGLPIASIMGRVSFAAEPTGKTIQVQLDWYTDETAYNNGEAKLSIMGVSGFPTKAMTFDLSNGDDPETWKEQTISVAHDEVKSYIDGLNYLATISGI